MRELSEAIILQDSTLIKKEVKVDTVQDNTSTGSSGIDSPGKQQNIDSSETVTPVPKPQTQLLKKDTVKPIAVKKTVSGKEIETKIPVSQIVEKPSLKIDTIERFSFFKSNPDSFIYKPLKVFISKGNVSKTGNFEMKSISHQTNTLHLNWTLSVVLLSVLILLFLKSIFNRFVVQVMNTMVNFQLADKMLREKNVIIRRAFILLNFNFVIIFSLFILLLTQWLDVEITTRNWLDYLIITGILVGILGIKLIVLYVLGYIFQTLSFITEYIHNIYLINKNVGLILLPLIFIIIYTSSYISQIAVIISISIVLIATVFKLLRGFQIIMRNGFLLFYSILYLCTLELLPLAIGTKLFTLLR